MRTYLFNGYRRISGEILFFGIPFAIGACPVIPLRLILIKQINFIGYATYSWAKSHDEYQNSKAAHIAAGVHHE